MQIIPAVCLIGAPQAVVAAQTESGEKREGQQSAGCEWSGQLGWKPLEQAVLLKPLSLELLIGEDFKIKSNH